MVNLSLRDTYQKLNAADAVLEHAEVVNTPLYKALL
jgi:hypothetical protein